MVIPAISTSSAGDLKRHRHDVAHLNSDDFVPDVYYLGNALMTKWERCIEETAEIPLEIRIDDAKRATSSELYPHPV